jgi:hypothetical protein
MGIGILLLALLFWGSRRYLKVFLMILTPYAAHSAISPAPSLSGQRYLEIPGRAFADAARLPDRLELDIRSQNLPNPPPTLDGVSRVISLPELGRLLLIFPPNTKIFSAHAKGVTRVWWQ